MIYVFEEGNAVYDGSMLSSEEKAQAIAVESLPAQETPDGHVPILRADKATERVWWEYVLAPEEPEPIPEPTPPMTNEERDALMMAQSEMIAMLFEMLLGGEGA